MTTIFVIFGGNFTAVYENGDEWTITLCRGDTISGCKISGDTEYEVDIEMLEGGTIYGCNKANISIRPE